MESKYTKAERRKIYLKAANLLSLKDDNVWCICGAFYKLEIPYTACQGVTNGYMNIFPEFAMFNPGSESKIWFGIFTPTAYEDRINCLLLCAEMCND